MTSAEYLIFVARAIAWLLSALFFLSAWCHPKTETAHQAALLCGLCLIFIGVTK